MQKSSGRAAAFTLIELLIVISIIIILMGLLFPVFRGAQDQAKRVQAKNDLAQIVTAVNAFYAEYGKYPLPDDATDDFTFGTGGDRTTNETLLNPLRGLDPTLNPRQIVFISPPDVKDPANPRSGIGTGSATGQYFDPWGTNYVVRIDGDYEGRVGNPYSSNAGATPDLQIGVIAWSLGKNKAGGSDDKKTGANGDDVISWQ
jgi:type II secretory pathway pseudopilin PulG